MADDAIRDNIVNMFHTIPGMGLTKATLLFDSGFTTISSLQRASVEDLSAIKGVSASWARYVLREVKTMSDDMGADHVQGKETPPRGPDDDSVTISLGGTPAGELEEGSSDDEEDEDLPDVDVDDAQEGAGLISGIISSFKSIFSGGDVEAKGQTSATELTEVEIEAAEATVEAETAAGEYAGTKTPPEGESEEQVAPIAPEPTDATITLDQGSEDKGGEGKEPEEDGKAGDIHDEDVKNGVDTGPGADEGATEAKDTGSIGDDAPKAQRSQTSITETAMHIASDIKTRSMASIKALRQRIAGRQQRTQHEVPTGPPGPSEGPEPEDTDAVGTKIEEGTGDGPDIDANDEKKEDNVKENNKPEKEIETTSEGKETKKKEKDTTVDDIINDLDLDKE